MGGIKRPAYKRKLMSKGVLCIFMGDSFTNWERRSAQVFDIGEMEKEILEELRCSVPIVRYLAFRFQVRMGAIQELLSHIGRVLEAKSVDMSTGGKST